jgi:GGDEF domain-containing protein
VREFAFDISPHTVPGVVDRRPELRLSVSIGVAHLPTHGTNLRELYAAADRSLYGAKAMGRDRVGPTADLQETRPRSSSNPEVLAPNPTA